jgi:hypothetical protein
MTEQLVSVLDGGISYLETSFGAFEEVAQSNARFMQLDTLRVVVHSIILPLVFNGVKNKGRPLSVMAHLKNCIIKGKAKKN